MLTGAPEICAACAGATLPPVARAHCPVCSQALAAVGAVCGNRICGWPPEQRYFTRVDAVAMYDGAMKQTLPRLKYDGRTGWALIYGRLVVGWLDNHAAEVADIDVIIGNPTAPDRRPQHVEAIMRAARDANRTGRWPIADPDKPLLVKTAATGTSAASGAFWQSKWTAAQAHAAALEVRSPVTGLTVLLVDDVFTTGAQMVTVSRLLREHGAREVRGLVLARAPWR
ncbi:ComF family protein [Kitasatospora paracochleata]|uniref:Amidophosphoribosyltransferase n=1 Tax=Kitasatospora paracochleata TaxID=58354 RepID=A0ABT1JB40_9ACTN|nr:phosphoribosyltransferase family protein [Kitasatospora paracochleata]MCP2314281.1 putative amidophosphoribosyltransferase [Kitasatospora paracochleata]